MGVWHAWWVRTLGSPTRIWARQLEKACIHTVAGGDFPPVLAIFNILEHSGMYFLAAFVSCRHSGWAAQVRLTLAFRANHRDRWSPSPLIFYFKTLGYAIYNFSVLQLHKHLFKGWRGKHILSWCGASYFLLERHVHFPSFLSLCCLDTTASELLSSLPAVTVH